jgi:hypothetical protein
MRPPVLLLLLLVATGCQYDPHAGLYTTVQPRPGDVVGTYRLVEQTVAPGGLGALEGRRCVVELHGDGTFRAEGVPLASADGADPKFFARLVAATGTWRIESVGSIARVSGPSRTHWGIVLDGPPERILPAGLTGQEPPLGLIFTIGDPDSGDALLLKRGP